MLRFRWQKLTAVFLFAVLSWLAWPAGGFAPLLFLAWVPLLAVEKAISNETAQSLHISIQSPQRIKTKPFVLFYLAFFLFNLITTWWIYFASPFGMFGAVAANALIMAFVFYLFHKVKYIIGEIPGYVFLVCAWTAFEFLHLDWDLTWPWLNLGNAFATSTGLIQWYEYTGTGGGTIWILTVNILLFRWLQNHSKKRTFTLAAVLLLPMIISHIILLNYQEESDPVEVVVIQPNIDPYNEKFSGMSTDAQMDRMLELAQKGITPDTKLCLLPETALPDGIWENQINSHDNIRRLSRFIAQYPSLKFITGAATYQYYQGEDYPATARKFGQTNDHYDAFNTALLVSKDSVEEIYHKSKLVPGVEKMPYPAVFGYLDQFAIDLGGIAGSLGMQDSSEVMKAGKIVAAPVICYESIYGEYVGSYVLRGANMISIITNDGWWHDTPGYRQHLQYGRLRAIEHRRSIARCANTGISCFIDQLGDIHQPSSWWVPAVIRQDINLNNRLTFYTRVGDWPGRLSLLTGLMLLAFAFFKKGKKFIKT